MTAGSKQFAAHNRSAIEAMRPGLNQMMVHLGIGSDEMRAICSGHKDYGSEWRQKDLDLVTNREFMNLPKANKIVLITWKQIRDLMRAQAVIKN